MALGAEPINLITAEPNGRVAIAPRAEASKPLTAAQERFAQLRARGENQLDAYAKAGYSTESADGGRSAASTLNRKPHVAARIDFLKRGALAEQIAPGTLPSEEAETLLPVKIDPTNFSETDVMRALVENAQLAREIGKVEASNAALKLLAEMKGFIGKADKSPKAKTPNKGEVDYDEVDDEGARTTSLIDFLAVRVQRPSGIGNEARDITPQAEGTGASAGNVPNDQAAIGHDRTTQPAISLDELARAFGEGVPRQTGE